MAITAEQLFATLPKTLSAAPIQYVNMAPPPESDMGGPGLSYDDRVAMYTSLYGQLPSYQQFSPERDGWDMSMFGAFNSDLLNPDNLEVIGYDANGNLKVKLKTADKEGTTYTYAKQPDGSFALQQEGTSQYWDTNQALLEDPMVLAMIAGVTGIGLAGGLASMGLITDPLAAGAASAAAGGEAAATGGGMLGLNSADPLLAALGPEGLALTETALGGATLGAPSLEASLLAALGPEGLAMTNTALAGAAMGGGTLGAGVLSGVAGGASGTAAGAAGAGAAGAAGAGAAAGAAGAGTAGLISALAPGVIQAITGIVGGGVANDIGEGATDAQLANSMAAAGDYKQAGMDYAAGLRALIPGLAQAYSYQPATVNNGVAQTEIDPVTGNVRFKLNEPWEQAYRGQMGAANGMLAELGNTNPNDIAKRMYDERMALIAPQREQQQQGLLQQLYAKGGYGLNLNTPTQLGSMAINPYVNSFAAANAQNDRQMAYDSWDQGQRYIDSLIGRQRGLFGDAAGIMSNANSALSTANTWGNTFTGANQNAANAVAGAQRDALGAEREATQRYIESVLGARQAATAQDAAGRTSTTDGLFGVINNLPSSFWSGVAGLFGG